MPFELQYTSAPRGLTLGQAGFTTVKMTKGMPLVLREALESLSSYHHARSSNGSTGNGVCTSLLQITAAGQRWYVLSRSADAGLDYTQRRNFFAHHIAFPPEEISGVDPLSILKGHDALLSKWDGKVEELDRKSRFSPSNAILSPAVSELVPEDWKDAILTESLSGRVVYVIGEDRLAYPLMESLMAAVPNSDRWNFTFITHFRSLSPTAKCNVRRISPSDMSVANVNRAQALVFNMANPGAAPSARRRATPPTASVPQTQQRPISDIPHSRPKAAHAQPTQDFPSTPTFQKPRRDAQSRSFGLGIGLGAAAGLVIALAVAIPVLIKLQSQNTQEVTAKAALDKEVNLLNAQKTDLQNQLNASETSRNLLREDLKNANAESVKANRLEENAAQDKQTIEQLKKDLNAANEEKKRQNEQLTEKDADIKKLNDEKVKLQNQNKPMPQEKPKEPETQPMDKPATKPEPKSLLPGLDEIERRTEMKDLPNRQFKLMELVSAGPEVTANPGKTLVCKFEKKDVASIKYEPQSHEIVFEWNTTFFSKQFTNDERRKIRQQLEKASLKVNLDKEGSREIPLLENKNATKT